MGECKRMKSRPKDERLAPPLTRTVEDLLWLLVGNGGNDPPGARKFWKRKRCLGGTAAGARDD